MTIQEVREYFHQNFTCEVLTSSECNKSDIQDFSSKIRNNTLEGYLKKDAWEDDDEGRTRVYLVRPYDGGKLFPSFRILHKRLAANIYTYLRQTVQKIKMSKNW